MSKQRAKGTAAESAVVDYIRHWWRPFAERHAQHGGKDIGDINFGPGNVIEVKSVSRHALGEWVAELECELDNAESDNGFVFVKKKGTTDVGDWYAITTVRRACELMNEAGY